MKYITKIEIFQACTIGLTLLFAPVVLFYFYQLSFSSLLSILYTSIDPLPENVPLLTISIQTGQWNQ